MIKFKAQIAYQYLQTIAVNRIIIANFFTEIK